MSCFVGWNEGTISSCMGIGSPEIAIERPQLDMSHPIDPPDHVMFHWKILKKRPLSDTAKSLLSPDRKHARKPVRKPAFLGPTQKSDFDPAKQAGVTPVE